MKKANKKGWYVWINSDGKPGLASWCYQYQAIEKAEKDLDEIQKELEKERSENERFFLNRIKENIETAKLAKIVSRFGKIRIMGVKNGTV